MTTTIPGNFQLVMDQLHALADLPDADVAKAARQWCSTLVQKRDFLADDRHPIIFIGKPGIGKSSIINVVADLLLGDSPPKDKVSLKNQAVLAVGGGRTTVCEVQIQAKPDQQYSLEIEPFSVDQMTEEIDLFARYEWRRRHSTSRRSLDDDAEPMAQELQRFILSMTGYAERYESYHEDGVRKKRLIKPLEAVFSFAEQENEFSETFSENDFSKHLVASAHLSARGRTLWTWPAGKENLIQLKQQFEAINQGSESSAMLPQKIVVTVPEPFLPNQSNLAWRLIDTRGLDGSMMAREDLYDWISDPRAVLVLCSEFKDAPEASIRTLMRGMADDALLRTALTRSILLLLDHGDAGQVNGAESDREIGQFLKIDECFNVLESSNSDLPKDQILAIDVLQDDCKQLLLAIDQKLQSQRSSIAEELQTQIQDALDFIQNVDNTALADLRQNLDEELKVIMSQHLPIGVPLDDPLTGLYEAIRPTHPASIVYATCRRRGNYKNLDLYAAIKSEAARAATIWLDGLILALQDKLRDLKQDPRYVAVRDHVNLRQVQISTGQLEVVQQYANATSNEIKEHLAQDHIWQSCNAEWGQGAGFKEKVIGYLKDWSSKQIRLNSYKQTEINTQIPLLNEVARPAQAPRFVLYVRNLRTLREVNWSPEPVSILIGANGAGKTTMLLVLKLLQMAYERDLPEAVNLVLGGINNMRSWAANEDDAIEIGLDIDNACWRLTLTPNGPSVNYLTRESLFIGTEEIFSRDELGQFRYNGQLLEPSTLLGLRVLMNRGTHQPAIRRIAIFMQRISVHFDPDLRSLRTQGSNTTEDRILHTRGTNTLAILRRWHLDLQESHRYQFVLDGLTAAFPNTVKTLDFEEAGNTVVARIYKPGVELPGPLRTEANGVIQMIFLLCAVAGADDESIVAIDEPENCLHPYAVMVFLRLAQSWARQHKLTILLTTHSTVLLDEMSAEPESVYVMKPMENSDSLPTRLDLLRNREWLAGFKLGDLYEQGEIGSNEDQV